MDATNLVGAGAPWPTDEAALVEVQRRVAKAARAALARDPWVLTGDPLVGGCFIAFARGQAGPGRAGDRAFAAAVVWRRGGGPSGFPSTPGAPASIVAGTAVEVTVPAAYVPGLLALREGPALAAAVDALDVRPDVLLVDATGRDHPRRAGLAVHLGAVAGVPTVGVTHRPLLARAPWPELRRGATAPLLLEGEHVASWVCTRTGARPVVAHAGWRTGPDLAAAVVLLASSEQARTPVPLREARRLARAARSRSAA